MLNTNPEQIKVTTKHDDEKGGYHSLDGDDNFIDHQTKPLNSNHVLNQNTVIQKMGSLSLIK